TTTNGSGRASSVHARSRYRATRAPNSTPTSGLVTKSRPARPAPPPRAENPGPPRPPPPPRAKNPPASSYRAASTNRSNGIGPSCRMRSAMRSARSAIGPSAPSAREPPLPDPGEQLGIDADHDDDGGREAERDAERRRRAR